MDVCPTSGFRRLLDAISIVNNNQKTIGLLLMVALRAAGGLSPMDDRRTHAMRRSLPARSHASAS
jgi:hypothetical protein